MSQNAKFSTHGN